MSYLEKQNSSFMSNMISASKNISTKRTAPAAKSGSSSSLTAAQSDVRRQRPEAPSMIYSQPADTGTGRDIMTQIYHAISHLRGKDKPQRLEDLLSYLSLQNRDRDYQRTITIILQHHGQIDYDPKGFDGKGSYAFRPMHNIRTGEQLLQHLQAQTSAQGLKASELLDGWPKAGEEIRRLEREHRLLVVRNKKDDQARMIWMDDPSLAQNIDAEFHGIWHKIKLPDAETLLAELKKADMIPTNKAKVVQAKPKLPEKKTKKPRRSGKTTNTHMVGILRDYSKK